jgi:hydrogenase maturation protease
MMKIFNGNASKRSVITTPASPAPAISLNYESKGMERSVNPSSSMTNTSQICVIGVGNADCGDDGAGPAVIDLLSEIGTIDPKIVKSSGETSGLIEILSETDKVILVDAIAAQSQEGTIHRFDASDGPLPAELFTNYSTHSMGVNEAIEMARALGELPEKTIVYGIEGINFEPGDTMCPEVKDNLDELLTTIRKEITLLNP